MKKQILLTALLATAFGINAVSIQQLLDEGRCPQVKLVHMHTTASLNVELHAELNLQGLEITDLTGLENIPFAKEAFAINLSDNNIENVDGFFDDFIHLNMLFLSHNKITSINNGPFNTCQKLKGLWLAHNKIEDLNVDQIQIPRLHVLNVENNHIFLSQEDIAKLRRKSLILSFGEQTFNFKFAD